MYVTRSPLKSCESIGKTDSTGADVLEILTSIWHTKAPTARLVHQRIRAVLEWGRRPHNALSAAFVRSAKPGYYCDGNGLYLRVDRSGARRWEQRLRIQGRNRTLGLGGYQLVSLAEAREKAFMNGKIARSGGDPRTERHKVRDMPTSNASRAFSSDLVETRIILLASGMACFSVQGCGEAIDIG